MAPTMQPELEKARKRPEWDPKLVLEDQNGIPNRYFEHKMGPGGPKRGPVADLGAQKGLPGIEVSPVWSPKWSLKSVRTRNKNQGGFGRASGERFSRFWLKTGAKMEPVGCRKRHENDFWS